MSVQFSGRVIHGDGIGRGLGFPTANLDVVRESLPLSSGIYASRVVVEKKKYLGSFVVREIPWKVEVYILGYHGEDLYGSDIQGEILQKISDLKTYTSRDALIEKIRNDVEQVKTFFGHAN